MGIVHHHLIGLSTLHRFHSPVHTLEGPDLANRIGNRMPQGMKDCKGGQGVHGVIAADKRAGHDHRAGGSFKINSDPPDCRLRFLARK